VNDLLTLFPEVASEWSSSLNENLRADQVSPTSSKRIWWRCPLGHDYQLSIGSRVKGSGCQICLNRVILSGFNDLLTKFPEVADEFAVDLNLGLKASEVGSGSGSSYWWRCSKGHTWKATVTNRTVLQSACPTCSERRIENGVNDFGSLNPEFLRQWSARNLDVNPRELGRSSSKIVWWDCEKGHSWKARVGDRTRGQGCAVCSNRQVVQGVNDLATTHSWLVEQIDENVNSKELANSIPAGTSKKIWWVCSQGHRWEAAVSSRTSNNTGCPFCSGNEVLPGVNDLESLNPDLAQEWNFLRNKQSPSEVKVQSMKRVWWLCRRGHEWQATVGARTSGTGCPFCANVRVLEGFNDLATVYPEIALTWDNEKNQKAPSGIMPGTHAKYWWMCSKGHSWQASPNKRIQGRNCPTCAPSGFVPGEPGVLYFLEHRQWTSFKIGITNVKGDRLKSLYRDGWSPLKLLTFAHGADAAALESACLQWIRSELNLPPYLSPDLMKRTGGWSETFSSELVSEKEVVSFVDSKIREFGFQSLA
jgi:hypothetical protein